jgi:hypothetical protein
MSGESMNMPPARCTGRVKRLILLLLGAVLLLTALLPAPPPVSSAEAVVTVSVTVVPSPVEINVRIPSHVREGVPFPVLAFIENSGDSRIEEAVATIHIPEDIEVILRGTEVDLGTIRTHGSTTAMWLVRALEEGNYVILVSISGTYDGDIVTGQDAALVTVRGR